MKSCCLSLAACIRAGAERHIIRRFDVAPFMAELPKAPIPLASLRSFSTSLGYYHFGETKLRVLPTSLR